MAALRIGVPVSRDGRVGVAQAAEHEGLERVKAGEALEFDQARGEVRRVGGVFADAEIHLDEDGVVCLARDGKTGGDGGLRMVGELRRAELVDDVPTGARDLGGKFWREENGSLAQAEVDGPAFGVVGGLLERGVARAGEVGVEAGAEVGLHLVTESKRDAPR